MTTTKKLYYMKKMGTNLSKLQNIEIINLYSEIITELKKRKIIRTKNLIGDLGEYLAINYYCNTPGLDNLQAAPAGTQNVDALSRKGMRYNIKSTTGKKTGCFHGFNGPDVQKVETQKFEFVIIVIITDEFKLNKIVEISWNQFLKLRRWNKSMKGWRLQINKNLIEEGKTIYTEENT